MDVTAHTQTVGSQPYDSMTRAKIPFRGTTPHVTERVSAVGAATSSSRHLGRVERAYGAAGAGGCEGLRSRIERRLHGSPPRSIAPGTLAKLPRPWPAVIGS